MPDRRRGGRLRRLVWPRETRFPVGYFARPRQIHYIALWLPAIGREGVDTSLIFKWPPPTAYRVPARLGPTVPGIRFLYGNTAYGKTSLDLREVEKFQCAWEE